MSDQEALQDSITSDIVDLGATCTRAPVAGQIPQSEDDTQIHESIASVNSSQERSNDANANGSENQEQILGDIRSLQSGVNGTGATPLIPDDDVLKSIPGQCCKGLYNMDEIIQVGRKLYDKYGNLDFTGEELAQLIEKKQEVKEKPTVVMAYVSLVTDLGHTEDGEHIIEIQNCDQCASKGKQPMVKWLPRTDRKE